MFYHLLFLYTIAHTINRILHFLINQFSACQIIIQRFFKNILTKINIYVKIRLNLSFNHQIDIHGFRLTDSPR